MPDSFELVVGGERVQAEVRVSQRSRRLRLVHSPGRPLRVTVPRGTGERALRRFLDESAGWIAKRLDEERERSARHSLGLARPGTAWFAGERLRIVRAHRRPLDRRPARRRLTVTGTEPVAALDRWYRREARRLVEAAAARHAERLGLRYTRIAVRDQRTRWGSCSTRGTLSFSWRLALAPPEVLEYVVVHELLHLREHNHSRAFWALLDETARAGARRRPGCESTARSSRPTYTRREVTSDASASSPARSFARASTLWLAAGLAIVAALGVAFRAYAYRSVLGIPNSDEAVLGLMARHAVHGELTTFIWGEAYGGPQETLLAVPGFALFGSSCFALRLVPIRLSPPSRRCSSGGSACASSAAGAPRRRRADLGLAAVHDLQLDARDELLRDAISSTGARCILLALRIVERPDALRVGLFGLVLGLAFWETSQIVPIASRRSSPGRSGEQPRSLRRLWLAARLSVLGALPWIVWNVRHDWASFHLAVGRLSLRHRLRALLLADPADAARAADPDLAGGAPAGGAVAPALRARSSAAFAYGAWRTRRRAARSSTSSLRSSRSSTGSRRRRSTRASRGYVFVLSPVLVLLARPARDDCLRRGRAPRPVGCRLVRVVDRMHKIRPHVAAGVPHAPRDLAPLIATLDRLQPRPRLCGPLGRLRPSTSTRASGSSRSRTSSTTISFVTGRAVLPDDPVVRSRAVRAQGAATIPATASSSSARRWATCRSSRRSSAHGYRRVERRAVRRVRASDLHEKRRALDVRAVEHEPAARPAS